MRYSTVGRGAALVAPLLWGCGDDGGDTGLTANPTVTNPPLDTGSEMTTTGQPTTGQGAPTTTSSPPGTDSQGTDSQGTDSAGTTSKDTEPVDPSTTTTPRRPASTRRPRPARTRPPPIPPALVAGATGAIEDFVAPRGGVIRLARRSGETSYTVTVAPVRREASPWAGNEPMALVLIADPSLTPMPSREALSQLFGFSASELRVAERLMTGDSPEEPATFLEVKTSTVRWHLASMYRKTGTNRQAELVRLLLSLAMI